MQRLAAGGAVVIGVSADSAESHQRFASKFDLPFELLSDQDKSVIEAYGAWGEKNMYGKKIMGIIRSTFIIDTRGMIVKQYRAVKVKGHVDEVLEELKHIS